MLRPKTILWIWSWISNSTMRKKGHFGFLSDWYRLCRFRCRRSGKSACQQSGQCHWILLAAEKEKGNCNCHKNKRNYLWIEIKNAISSSVLQKNAKLLTTKANRKYHGFGTESIRNLVEKYDGGTEYYEKDGWFVLDIMMRNQYKSTSCENGIVFCHSAEHRYWNGTFSAFGGRKPAFGEQNIAFCDKMRYDWLTEKCAEKHCDSGRVHIAFFVRKRRQTYQLRKKTYQLRKSGWLFAKIRLGYSQRTAPWCLPCECQKTHWEMRTKYEKQ